MQERKTQMLRILSGGLVCLAVVLGSWGSNALGQSPPVAMPETPPAFPSGAVDRGSFGNRGSANGGQTLPAPADRPPRLPHAPPMHLHGEQTRVEPQRGYTEWVYDETNHALTIYLPRSFGMPADAASPHDGHSYGHWRGDAHVDTCPLDRYDEFSSGCRDCAQGHHRYGGAYACEYERYHRATASNSLHYRPATFSAWNH